MFYLGTSNIYTSPLHTYVNRLWPHDIHLHFMYWYLCKSKLAWWWPNDGSKHVDFCTSVKYVHLFCCVRRYLFTHSTSIASRQDPTGTAYSLAIGPLERLRSWATVRFPITVSLLIMITGLTWYIFNCNLVDTRSQQYSTYLHTISTKNTANGTYITIKKFKTNLGSAGRASSLRVIPWHLLYNWGKARKTLS
jgi:hypothetical protein